MAHRRSITLALLAALLLGGSVWGDASRPWDAARLPIGGTSVVARIIPDGAALADTTTGLTDWWKLHEGTGTTAANSARAGAGTLASGMSWASPGPGVLADNVTSHYVSVPTTLSSRGQEQVVIAARVVPAANSAPVSYVWQETVAGSTTVSRIVLFFRSTRLAGVWFRDADGSAVRVCATTVPVVITGVPNALVAVIDTRADVVTLWANGTQVNRCPLTMGTIADTAPGVVRIGSGESGTSNDVGRVWDVRRYHGVVWGAEQVAAYTRGGI